MRTEGLNLKANSENLIVYYITSEVVLILVFCNESSAAAEMGNPLAIIDMGVPLFFGGGGAGSQTKTMSPGPRLTSVYQLAS